ncbi:hypothetical protein ABMA28_001657 [Loxostege sticticalis]|uniref:DUF7869 domain-containing protein n=1 Tax=Loxostege sticticalis TaxID=481309 RepID=A0ABD0T2G3_LOXSC
MIAVDDIEQNLDSNTRAIVIPILDNLIKIVCDGIEDDAVINPNQKDLDPHSRIIVISILDTLLKRIFSDSKSRKRWMKPNPDNWKRNVAKKRRSDGLPYITKNKERKAKVPKDIDCSKCFYKCNLPEEARELLCRHYWSLSFIEKMNFILGNLLVEPPKRVLAVKGSKRQRKFTTKCYFFHDGSKQQVCQKYFCSTLAISPTVINNAIEKRNQCGLYDAEDKRGKKEPPNKTNEAAVNFVKMHIESFPTMEPHYIRKTSKRLYLDATLSITKMYQLYKSKCADENVIPVTEITYRRIFCNNYNYSFFVPKKDQCLLCSKYNKATPEGKLQMKKDYDDHLARKEACNTEKNKDKERASKEKHFYCLTFDLQAVLQIPSGLVGQLYYSRKLCVYNLCMYEAALPNNAYCFAWTEVNGKRGSSEIGSILYHYLSKCVPHGVSEVCLYSDTCGGQNRNQFVTALLLFAVQNIEHLKQIEHKFLESGHSYMEVDSMHSSIESAKKNCEIYCMPDYVSIFKRARGTKTVTVEGVKHTKLPYQVKEFKYDEFYDLKKLAEETINQKAKDCNGDSVKWLKIKRMRYLKSEPGKVLFNYDMSEEFLSLDVSGTAHVANNRPKRRKEKENTRQASQVTLKKLYSKPLPITKAKKRDLLALCQKKVIPEEYHGWFSSLAEVDGSDRLPEPADDEDSSEE